MSASLAVPDRDSILRPALPCLCPQAWSIISSLESTAGSCGDEHTAMSNKNTLLQSGDWQWKKLHSACWRSEYLFSLSSAKAMFVWFLFCTRGACWGEKENENKRNEQSPDCVKDHKAITKEYLCLSLEKSWINYSEWTDYLFKYKYK